MPDPARNRLTVEEVAERLELDTARNQWRWVVQTELRQLDRADTHPVDGKERHRHDRDHEQVVGDLPDAAAHPRPPAVRCGDWRRHDGQSHYETSISWRRWIARKIRATVSAIKNPATPSVLAYGK